MPEPNPLVVSKDIEKDMKETFDAIDEAPLNLPDKLGSFRFYLSGIKSGYEITMRSARLDLRISLIDSIYRVYGDYDEGIKSRDATWKEIAEILA